MSVVIETTLGDITVDLYLNDRPRACLNFLKLCKIKYYNYNLFHTISRGFIAQTGDPTGSRSGGESMFGILDGPLKRFFEGENEPRIKHTKMGLISFVGNKERMISSQFFLTLGEDLTYLDEKHCVFGEVVEGFDILEVINEVICDKDDRPYQDVRVTHTVILDDPYPSPKRLVIPSRSPSPSAERLQGGRIAPDEEIDEMEGKSAQEVSELQAEREAKARATILEMVGDLPDADMAPPENVLFVCKLNPVTSDDDLEIIFSRFGKIKSCEVIRDKKTGDSLQYAFVEFAEQKSCEDAYFKMDNVLIDDRRIHVDFSQSVSKVKWHGKGRGVTHYDDKGNKSRTINSDIGKGNYKNKGSSNIGNNKSMRDNREVRDRSETPNRNHGNRQRGNPSNISRDRDSSKYGREKSPKRDRNFISPQRSKSRYDRESSRNKRDRSRSPKRRSASPLVRRKREYPGSPPGNRSRGRSPEIEKNGSKEGRYKPSSSRRSPSPRRDRHQSTSYRENLTRHRGRSKSPRRSNDRGNGYCHDPSAKYSASSSKKLSSSEIKSNERKKIIEVKEKGTNKSKISSKHKTAYSKSDEEPRKQNTKKKSKYSSSDSDSDKQEVTSESSSSDSSDSDNYQRKKPNKKNKKKNKSSSSSDSVEYKNKKFKKKKRKYESDSD